jgi:hypothetical protein
MQVNDILMELRQERQRQELLLAALNQAIAAFDSLSNGGRKRRGRPRRFAPKVLLDRVEPMRQTAGNS